MKLYCFFLEESGKTVQTLLSVVKTHVTSQIRDSPSVAWEKWGERSRATGRCQDNLPNTHNVEEASCLVTDVNLIKIVVSYTEECRI